MNSISDLPMELIDELFFLRGIVSFYYRETNEDNNGPGHVGISFEHGRAGSCMSSEKETLHCYHPHLCCYPARYNFGSGFSKEPASLHDFLWDTIELGDGQKASSLYDINDLAGLLPYLYVEQCFLDLKERYETLFREFWDARVYLLDDEHDLTMQYLRKKLAGIIQEPHLWDWKAYPEREKVNRLVQRFRSWMRGKKDFYQIDFSGPIPEIRFAEAVSASTQAGYDVLADSFKQRWQGILQYETIGKFIQTIPRSADPDHPPKLLDAGCGPGFYVKVFNSLGFDCYAIDNSAVMIEHAKQYLGETMIFSDHGTADKIKLMRSSMENMRRDFKGFFSAIWYSAVILHQPRVSIDAVLTGLSELLITNGILYFSFREDKGAEVRFEGRVFFYYSLEEMLAFINQSKCWTVLDIWDGQTTKGTIHRDNRVKKWKHLLLKKG